MRVVLDSTRCQGHGRCYTLAPALFAADDEGYAVLLKADVELDQTLHDDARIAADNCPEFAIDVTE
jgi:ferredoxin